MGEVRRIRWFGVRLCVIILGGSLKLLLMVVLKFLLMRLIW